MFESRADLAKRPNSEKRQVNSYVEKHMGCQGCINQP